MHRVPRLAATLAGLALVGVPAAISMATTDHASRARPEQTLMQPLRSTIATPHRLAALRVPPPPRARAAVAHHLAARPGGGGRHRCAAGPDAVPLLRPADRPADRPEPQLGGVRLPRPDHGAAGGRQADPAADP